MEEQDVHIMPTIKDALNLGDASKIAIEYLQRDLERNWNEKPESIEVDGDVDIFWVVSGKIRLGGQGFRRFEVQINAKTGEGVSWKIHPTPTIY